MAIGVSQGALVLTHAIPTDWIPIVTAWCGIIAFVGSSVLTALNGMATTAQSRIASAAAVPEVTAIHTSTAQASVADLPKVTNLTSK